MPNPVDALMRGLPERIGPRPGPHAEVVAAGRACSCRLPVWEEAGARRKAHA